MKTAAKDGKAAKTHSPRYVEALKKRAARDRARADRLQHYIYSKRIRPPEAREFGYHENSWEIFSSQLYFENLRLASDFPLAAHENAVDDEDFQRFMGCLGSGGTRPADSVQS